MDCRYGQIVRIGGMISKLLPKVSQAGRHTKPASEIDLLLLKDQAGEVQVLAFRDTFAKCSLSLRVGMAIIVIGAVYCVDKPTIFADQVISLSEAPHTYKDTTKSPDQ